VGLIDRLRSLFRRVDREASYERSRRSIRRADQALADNAELRAQVSARLLEEHRRAERAMRSAKR
jgi:hypothetical protein